MKVPFGIEVINGKYTLFNLVHSWKSYPPLPIVFNFDKLTVSKFLHLLNVKEIVSSRFGKYAPSNSPLIGWASETNVKDSQLLNTEIYNFVTFGA